MQLGLHIRYSGAQAGLDIPLIQEAEALGYHSIWTSEAYGSDAVSTISWIGAHTKTVRLGTAIMQMPGRSPAMTAMTAMTLDHLSGGRFLLGLGLSGPQVAEGWHGQAYGKPLGKTREYVSMVRKIFAREEPLVHEGKHYQVPYKGPDATGLGKPLKSIIHGRKDLPIYLAAIGPKNVALTGEIGDGLLTSFFSPDKSAIWEEPLKEGFALAGEGKDFSNFDFTARVVLAPGDDLAECRNSVKPYLGLYIGGMGAKGKNFYNDLAKRYGYEEAAEKIQELYLSGNQQEAIGAVPDELVDEVALCGPRERIIDRFSRYRNQPFKSLNIFASTKEALRLMAELAL
ncbi:MAG: LLM class F420-dependent oxidoreductase [SAR324 cluster bacterium]|nr:LLM class F420-dependent oxidoreductase [SAR324 cluster bacterium]MCZ6647595.1 LLM class F420-dependent oxidoreductase [SAR324 cluster bacterium]MCZ6843761.1 LLM class F420-dependent oxidoreductase [SAR324 cluster bacterium]